MVIQLCAGGDLTSMMPNTHRRRPRDETVLSRRRCEHNSQLAHDNCRRIRSTIWKLTKQTTQRLITPILLDIDNFFNNDVIMLSLLKKLSISIKIHVVKQLWSLFGQFPNCRPNPSAVVVSQLRIVFTPPTRRNSTVSSRRRWRCVLGISKQYVVHIQQEIAGKLQDLRENCLSIVPTYKSPVCPAFARKLANHRASWL